MNNKLLITITNFIHNNFNFVLKLLESNSDYFQ